MKIVAAEGTHKKIGFELGRKLAEEIRYNISVQEQYVIAGGIEDRDINNYVESYVGFSDASSLKLMEGLSSGSNIPLKSILRFNALQDVLCPEECTTFAAVGNATSNGKAVLLKNRDTHGNYNFVGSRYFEHRAINVILALKTENGNVIVGVSTAGSTGLMMGLNKYGVASASNFGHILEISHLSSDQLHGISGRPQMMREALECSSAKEAVDLTLSKLTLTESPMKAPGILWFVDAGNIYVIESAFKQFAVQHITDGTASRSNHFLLLDQLNNEQAVSSICRKIRSEELLKKSLGSINREEMIEFSMDHKNGPSENSICRHSKDPNEAVTVSSAIMEIDSENAQKSKISIALGSPCWAWNNENGNCTFQMDQDISSIPQNFVDGSAYKEFIKTEAFQR
ncbi:MAG TPA: C45 family autoproteolytic acyltransferase/hydrolase [Bacillota bacterium]|nr:C45 family autoproteolytic acyltransferase/hydrolase [Bacillota bacterium]HQI16441.1 C45 family autoproteolytic acyltransferase/hydrolase [Bacillota bacterium]HQJ36929.1 C45 family autoproteolytic acyltransferase/hydrolase [Bacillota bacterium]HRS20280.1 C45 family autoproteolytic acyltransferase/hydrolase [Clostridia bacterium]